MGLLDMRVNVTEGTVIVWVKGAVITIHASKTSPHLVEVNRTNSDATETIPKKPPK